MEDIEFELEYKDIRGYEGLYQVNNLGDVYSFYLDDKLKPCIDKGYFIVSLYKDKKKTTAYIHRLIYAYHFPDKDMTGLQVDHKDNITTNNDIENLRLTDSSGNNRNRSKRKNTSSKYLGVYWNKRDNKWMAHIRIDGKRKNLGYFDKEEDASDAYLEAKAKYHLIKEY